MTAQRSAWSMVAASVLGLTVGSATINLFVFSAFLKPISDDLGLSRSALSFGILVASVMNGLATPLVGMLVDRCGSRAILLPGISLFALAVSALSLLQPSPIELIYLQFALVGLFGATQTTVPYATLLSKWFDRDRGLAMGIAMAGVGLGVVILPELADALIGAFGWRAAYPGIGLAIVVLALCPVALTFREPPRDHNHKAGLPNDKVGPTAGQVLTGSWRFWIISIGFFIGVVAINGTLGQLIPILTDRGMTGTQGATILSAAGVAVMLGRVASGWCLDKFYGPYVAVGFFLLPSVGVASIASEAGGVVPLLGAVACGTGFGAQTGLQAIFISRYFGLRAYGTLYGTTRGIFLVGSGAGLYVASAAFDLWQSYETILLAFGLGLLIVAIAFSWLGPYQFGPQPSQPQKARASMPPRAATLYNRH